MPCQNFCLQSPLFKAKFYHFPWDLRSSKLLTSTKVFVANPHKYGLAAMKATASKLYTPAVFGCKYCDRVNFKNATELRKHQR